MFQRLREIDIVSWKLSPVRKKILFGFIEKYKMNPSMLQIRPKPKIPTKRIDTFPDSQKINLPERNISLGIKPREKPAIVPKPKTKIKSCPPNLEKSLNKSTDSPDRAEVPETLPRTLRNKTRILPSNPIRIPPSNPIMEITNEKEKTLPKFDPRAPLPTPTESVEISVVPKNTSDNYPNHDNGGYIDMDKLNFDTKKSNPMKPTPGSSGYTHSRSKTVSSPEVPKLGKQTIDVPVSKIGTSRNRSPVSITRQPKNDQDQFYENQPTVLKVKKADPKLVTSLPPTNKMPSKNPTNNTINIKVEELQKKTNHSENFLSEETYEAVEQIPDKEIPPIVPPVTNRAPTKNPMNNMIIKIKVDRPNENPSPLENFQPEYIYEAVGQSHDNMSSGNTYLVSQIYIYIYQ